MMDNNMGCSIIGDDIKIIVEQADKPFLTQGSALQNPELNRAQLLTMLRKAARSAAPRRRKLRWDSFMSSFGNQEPANTNQ